MILTLLSLSIILTYVGVMVYRNGIPYSISDTFYPLEHKLWFGATMWLTALLLMPGILDSTPNDYQFLAFLMCAGLMFVGAAPNFKKGTDRPVHIAATSVAGICSQIWVCLSQPYLLLLWIVFAIYITMETTRNWTGAIWTSLLCAKPLFWAELVAFATIYAALIES